VIAGTHFAFHRVTMKSKAAIMKPVDSLFVVIPAVLTVAYWLASFSG